MAKTLRIAWVAETETTGPFHLTPYVSAMLLPYLSREFEVELFSPAGRTLAGLPVRHPLSAWQRHRTKPFDLAIYQVEDGIGWSRIFPALIPSVTIFHDVLFTSHGPEPILNSAWEETVQRFQNGAHPWPPRGAEFKQRAPFGFREAACAFSPLFSQQKHIDDYRSAVELSLRDADSAPPALYLPVPIGPVGRARGERSEVCFAGTPRIEHRAHLLLRALRNRGEGLRLTWLIDPTERAPAEELIREFSGVNVTLVEGRTPERWSEIARESSLAVHTLFSVFGHLSPFVEISLAAGLPVIATQFGVAEAFPNEILLRVQPGETECGEMEELLALHLAGKLPATGEIGRAYSEEIHSAPAVAAELSRQLRRAAPYLASQMERWSSLERDARSSLVTEVRGDFTARASAEAWDRLIQPTFEELGW